MKSKTVILSKSKLMDGLQCEKKLWLKKYKPELEGETSAATQMQFDEGNLVELLAQKHFGPGDVVATDYWDYEGAVQATLEFITGGSKTIFEASFKYQSFFARADIFSFNSKKKAWDIIEVKKSSSVKDYHLLDSAIQIWIILKSGYKVNTVAVMHLNSDCVFPDLSDLFIKTDVTDHVMALIPEVEKKIAELVDVVQSKSEPKIKIGPHCNDPYECAFKAHCWAAVPEKSVFDLPGMGVKAWDIFDSGKTKITELDADDFKGKTQKTIEVTKSNKLWVDKSAIQSELSNFTWPLYFFDFETIMPAVPRYEGTSPYTQVPFQFSCHVWSSLKNKLTHFEYLHTDASDPRPGIIKAMLAGLGDSGSIVAYNKGFEVSVIKKLAEFDPKNSRKLLKLIDRFVDPLPIFRKHTYHPDYLGSFSIKDVAPALLGSALSYSELDVGSGLDAQVYANLLLQGLAEGTDDLGVSEDGTPITKERMIQSLLTYCRQDTLAMVELVKWLMAQK